MQYRFDDYELNTQTRELHHLGTLIPLTPKAYSVLAYLIRHRDRLVPKDELLDQVWSDTYVDDSAVKRNIMALRRALGRRSGPSQTIKTQRSQGYRFIIPVQELDTPSQPDSAGLTCPQCGQQVPPQALFCSACGQSLMPSDPTPIPSPPPTLGHPLSVGERKLITALCCNVIHLPQQIDGAELEARHHLMQRLYTMALEEAQPYCGTLQTLTSDGFLILFGVPRAQADHAQRAVMTAQRLQHRVQHQQPPLHWPSGAAPTLRLALHTGWVVAGQLQGHQHDIATFVGDVTILASALAQQAPGDTILASAATVELLQDTVQMIPHAPLTIDAISPTLSVYQIMPSLAPQAPRLLSQLGSSSPFVGRAAELAMLRARWAQVKQGQGQVVGMVGEPGMGKSRLLQQFGRELCNTQTELLTQNPPENAVPENRSRNLNPQVTSLLQDCSGQPYSQSTPYAPIIDLLHVMWAISANDPADVVTAKVQTGLQDAGLDANAISPYLLSLLGLDLDPQAVTGMSPEVFRARTFDALHQLFLHRSQRQSRAMVVENAHWLDATSEAYFTALIDRLAGASILLLVTFRPGYRPTWVDKSYVTQIALQPLDAADSREIIQAVFGAHPLDDSQAQQFLTKAEGNPLFLEELARSVIGQDGSHSSLAPLPTPNSIHAVLAERIDRLPHAEKQLLQTAAVVGHQVPVSLLCSVSGLAEADLSTHLRQLQASEFLHETGFVPEPLYTFKHALTHEVAYASLLHDQRRHLHGQIVTVLERETDRTMALTEALAHHALGGELWDKVGHYFDRAGTYAIARSAFQEAATCFEQALHGISHLDATRQTHEQSVDLRLRLHTALLRLGKPAASYAVLQEAQPIAEALDDAYRLGWIASYLSTHHFIIGEADAALACGQRAHALADVCDDEALTVDVRLHLGQTYHARGAYAAAIAHLQPNIEFLSHQLRDPQVDLARVIGLHSFAWIILCVAETGDFAQSKRYAVEALRIAAIGERPYEQVALYASVGLLELRRGQLSQAIERLEPALSLCQTAGIHHLFPTIASHLGAAYAHSGRLPEAIDLLEQAVSQAAAMHIMVYHALSIVYLGEAYYLAGRLSEAREQAERALRLAQTHKESGHEAWARHLLGTILAHVSGEDITPATTALQHALAQADAMEMRPLLAHCHFSLGNLYRLHGHAAQAGSELSTALALYQSMGMDFWAERIQAVLGSS